jgi:hypothetical protein
VSELDELRRAVVSERGLPEASAHFLTGETVEQVEASALEFEKLLVEKRPEQESATSFLGAVAAGKAARQRALVNLLTGREPPQPRDERGRFESATASFDGGARRRSAQSQPEGHDSVLLRVLRSGEANAGGRGF